MKLQKPLILTAILTVAAGMVGLSAVSVSQSITAHEQSALIAELANNSDALREQVKDSGEVPVAPPADAVVEKSGAAGAPGVNGRDGATGVNGINGAAGAPGAPGISGVDGLNGSTGAPGAPGQTGADGSTGSPGSAGAPGATGPQGAPGADYTTQPADGLPGMPGVAGPRGEPGPAGADGQPGADSAVPGPDGPAGDPGPVGAGIAAILCQADGAWLFTLTDSTELVIDGPCRIPATPTEPPLEGATP